MYLMPFPVVGKSVFVGTGFLCPFSRHANKEKARFLAPADKKDQSKVQMCVTKKHHPRCSLGIWPAFLSCLSWHPQACAAETVLCRFSDRFPQVPVAVEPLLRVWKPFRFPLLSGHLGKEGKARKQSSKKREKKINVVDQKRHAMPDRRGIFFYSTRLFFTTEERKRKNNLMRDREQQKMVQERVRDRERKREREKEKLVQVFCCNHDILWEHRELYWGKEPNNSYCSKEHAIKVPRLKAQ